MRHQAEQPEHRGRLERPADREPLLLELQRDRRRDEAERDGGEQRQVVQPARRRLGIARGLVGAEDARDAGERDHAARGEDHREEADGARAPVGKPGGAEQQEQRRPDQRRGQPDGGGPAPHAGLRRGQDERQRHEQHVDRDLGDDRDRAGVEREVERVPRAGEETGGERRQRHERRPGAADRDEQHQRDVETEQPEERRRRGVVGPRQGAVQADVGDDGRDEHGQVGAQHPRRVVVDAEPIADERDDRVGDRQQVGERQHARRTARGARCARTRPGRGPPSRPRWPAGPVVRRRPNCARRRPGTAAPTMPITRPAGGVVWTSRLSEKRTSPAATSRPAPPRSDSVGRLPSL